MRKDPTRLDLDNYPFRGETATRYADLDELGHLNNLSTAAIFQEARMRFLDHHGLWRNPATRSTDVADAPAMMVVSLSFQFIGQAFYPRPIEVGSGVVGWGRSSFTIGHLAAQDGRPVAISEAVLAFVRDGQSVPIAPDVLAQFEEARLHTA